MIALAMMLLSPSAHAEHKPAYFRPFTPQIYRGGRPGSEDSESYLKSHGFRAIINLQGNAWQVLPGEQPSAIEESRALAKQVGLRFFNFPVPAGQKLDTPEEQATVLNAVKALEDPANLPVYIHCNAGVDRTGLVLAAYRILHENCSFEQAKSEFVEHGAPWSPALESVQMPFLRELAARPEAFGRVRSTLRCPLP